MFSNNIELIQFLKKMFPELAEKLSFGVLIDKGEKNKRSAALFVKKNIEVNEKEKISSLLLKISNITEVTFKRAGVLPFTDILMLVKIKQCQPIKYNELSKFLKQDNVSFEEIELKRSLDKFRKKKMIIKNSDGFYNVTENALSYIPHGNTRNSSDIKRLLELGKRKW